MTKMALSVMKRPKCPFLLLIYIVLTLLSQCGLGLAQILDVSLEPSFMRDLKTKESRNVSVRIAYDMTKVERRQLHLKLLAEIRDEKVAKIVDQSLTNFTLEDFSIAETGDTDDDKESDGKESSVKKELNVTLTVKGLFIGKTQLVLSVLPAIESQSHSVKDKQEDDKPKNDVVDPLVDNLVVAHHDSDHDPDPDIDYRLISLSMDVWVQNGDRTLIAIFVSTLGCLIIIANLLMGCQLNLDVVWEVLKRPVAPCIGFVCQFLLMPLIAYTLARAIMFPAGLYTLGLGLFTTGCVPGGGASNFWTILLEGNSDLSITMTAVSTVAAFGMMPLWMFLLGEHFLVEHPETKVKIPYANILMSLSCLVVPLFIGVLIKRFFPKVAGGAKKILRPFLIFIIVFILTFGVYANLYMFQLMSWRVLLAGLLLPWCGFMFGCFAGLISRQPPANVAAIAIETGIQNSGIAIMLLKVSFPQPDADLSSVVPVVVSIFTPGPLLLGVAVHAIMCFMKKRQEEKWKRLNLYDDGEKGAPTPLTEGKEDADGGKEMESQHMTQLGVNGVENKAATVKISPKGSPKDLARARVEEVTPLARKDPVG